jgi:K+-transporting ATPase A subunit
MPQFDTVAENLTKVTKYLQIVHTTNNIQFIFCDKKVVHWLCENCHSFGAKLHNTLVNVFFFSKMRIASVQIVCQWAHLLLVYAIAANQIDLMSSPDWKFHNVSAHVLFYTRISFCESTPQLHYGNAVAQLFSRSHCREQPIAMVSLCNNNLIFALASQP